MDSICYSNSNSSGGIGSSGITTITTGGVRWETCDQCNGAVYWPNVCDGCNNAGGHWVQGNSDITWISDGTTIIPSNQQIAIQPLICPAPETKKDGIDRALERLEEYEKNTCPHCKKQVK